jgi:hypothetical protein
MSKSFTRHYHSYKYIPAAFALFLFAFAIFYNLVAGFLSDGVPTAMVVLQDGELVETDASMLWLVMHFMMLALLFVVIVMVAYAWDTKSEPRPMIRHPIVNRDELVAKREKERRIRMHRQFKQGFSRHHLRQHLLDKGHSREDIEEALDRHNIR